jgi:Protein of unknown function/Domain of unknown function (DUF1835)
MATIHVVFCTSAAEELRDAFAKVGRTDQVAAFPDNLSYGPINPPDPDVRAQWMVEELHEENLRELRSSIEAFWATALAETRRVAWLSRQSTSDYTGFLEWLRRVGDANFDLVDLTHAHVVRRGQDGQSLPPQPALPLALIHSDTIVRSELWDLARPIIPAERESYHRLWERLRTENAPLRVLKEGQLVSAPMSHFDPLVLSCVTLEWRRAMLTVGYALASYLDDGCFQTTDTVLCTRIRALIQAGQIEARGDLSDLRRAELRVPDRRASDGAAGAGKL